MKRTDFDKARVVVDKINDITDQENAFPALADAANAAEELCHSMLIVIGGKHISFGDAETVEFLHSEIMNAINIRKTALESKLASIG